MKRKKVVSFLASGRGSNFIAVRNKIEKGEINAKLGILISDKSDAKALKIAQQFKMDAFFVDPLFFSTREEHDKAIVKLLKENKTDLVVAAGYMRILTPYFVKMYRNKIINIHPALLPAFPGIHAQRLALEKGVKITGCTTHFINEGTDTGPIIMQRAVPVLDNDNIETLSARILKEEHRILPDSVKLFCDDKLKIIHDKVIIKN
ncbi:MAG: phosphoribosylglycinamide formyltransferase [Spirochaetota bacterium]|nr:phosphoribosylglycinamide formyltransferase [Spirochaetota bacterium]